jgi:hypothetical protein
MSGFARSAVALRRLLRKTAGDRDVRWGGPTKRNQARDGPAPPWLGPAVPVASAFPRMQRMPRSRHAAGTYRSESPPPEANQKTRTRATRKGWPFAFEASGVGLFAHGLAMRCVAFRARQSPPGDSCEMLLRTGRPMGSPTKRSQTSPAHAKTVGHGRSRDCGTASRPVSSTERGRAPDRRRYRRTSGRKAEASPGDSPKLVSRWWIRWEDGRSRPRAPMPPRSSLHRARRCARMGRRDRSLPERSRPGGDAGASEWPRRQRIAGRHGTSPCAPIGIPHVAIAKRATAPGSALRAVDPTIGTLAKAFVAMPRSINKNFTARGARR